MSGRDFTKRVLIIAFFSLVVGGNWAVGNEGFALGLLAFFILGELEFLRVVTHDRGAA